MLSRAHSHYDVFVDFLVMTLTQFTLPDDEGMVRWHREAMSRYSDSDKKLMNALFHALVGIYNEQIITRERKWFDALGDFYMYISSRSTSSRLGQFFTPPTVVDLMVQINVIDHDPHQAMKGKVVSDPCCGSGRFSLSFNSHAPGNYHSVEDIDYVCCLMTLVNFCFHGVNGEVTNHDSLVLNEGRSWRVVADPRRYPVPVIKTMDYHDTMIYQVSRGMLTRAQAKNEAPEGPSEPPKKINGRQVPGKQLSLFEAPEKLELF